MKKLVVIIGILVAGISLKAQSQQAYISAMSKGLQSMGAAQTMEDWQAVAGQFERVGAKVTDQWHPQYYAALAYINMSFRVNEVAEKDKLTDKAQGFIDAAKKLAPNNSEVVALQGFKYMIELSADPGTRGQNMSPMAMQQLGKAVTMDPNNPRANIFLAQMELGMAQFFGSPTDKACEKGQKALDLFNSAPEEKSLDPSWGKETAEEFVKQCGL